MINLKVRKCNLIITLNNNGKLILSQMIPILFQILIKYFRHIDSKIINVLLSAFKLDIKTYFVHLRVLGVEVLDEGDHVIKGQHLELRVEEPRSLTQICAWERG